MSKRATGRQDIEHVTRSSADILAESIDDLKRLFPNVVTEGKIDFAKLREALGDEVDDRPERYSFTWAGKRDAIRLLQTPSRATLVPVPGESVNFDSTNNVFIEGENLEVLKLLYKSYAGRVKMIYIDPPYNTGNDFIYPDNFADPLDTYLKLTGQKDSEGNLLTSNPETSGRYHSAWLTMMYPRLFVARQLLREDGVIFISIDDNEAGNLRLLVNEVFGEENFVTSIMWQRKVSPSNDATWFSSDHEQLLVFARNKEVWRPNRLPMNDRQKSYYTNPDGDPRGPWNSATYTCNKTKQQRPNLYYPITNPNTGEEVCPKETAVWAYSRELSVKHAKDGLLYWGKDGKSRYPRLKSFLSEAGCVVPRTVWLYAEVGSTQEATQEMREVLPDARFDTPKPPRLIAKMLDIGSDACGGDIILDFFAGSGTTAQTVLEKNHSDTGDRRFVLVQLPEPTEDQKVKTIAEMGKTRIRNVIEHLRNESKGKLDLTDREAPEDLGFKVFKLAESNYQRWRGTEAKTGEALLTEMEKQIDPLLPGWKPRNVIYEVALKEGYSLTCSVEEVTGTGGNTVYRVTDPDKGQSFLICLDDKLKPTAIKALGLKKDDLFICRDVALTDEQAANLALQCNLKTV